MFDTEVAECDAPPALDTRAAPHAGRGRDGQEQIAHQLVWHRRHLGEWGGIGLEELPVERDEPQPAEVAAEVREARHGLEGRPESARPSRIDEILECRHGVTVSVNGVPQRHEGPGLGEEQKKDAAERRQRLFEDRGR